MDPVPLRDTIAIGKTAGQSFRLLQTADPNDPRGPYKVQTVSYFYAVSTRAEDELLTFQWTPEDPIPRTMKAPHLHVGRVLMNNQAVIRPGDLQGPHPDREGVT
jgi:hypothetical protein